MEKNFKDLDDSERSQIEIVSIIFRHNSRELFLRTEATAGLVLATTALLWMIGLIALVGRICTDTEDSTRSAKIFTCLVSRLAIKFYGDSIHLARHVYYPVSPLHPTLLLYVCHCWDSRIIYW